MACTTALTPLALMQILILLEPQAVQTSNYLNKTFRADFLIKTPSKWISMYNQAKFQRVVTSGSASIGSSIPDFMASTISFGDILNSVSPIPSMWTFFGTHATIAAGTGAEGLPKSEINSNTSAPMELTYTTKRV